MLCWIYLVNEKVDTRPGWSLKENCHMGDFFVVVAFLCFFFIIYILVKSVPGEDFIVQSE